MYKLRREGYNHRFWNSQYLYKAQFDFVKHFPLYSYGSFYSRNIGKKSRVMFNKPSRLYSGGIF